MIVIHIKVKTMRNNWINVMVILFIIQMKIYGQLNPAITSWLQNTTQTGFYYMAGNSTPLSHGILVNCQLVRYSSTDVYVNATGIPSYHIGPYLDNNPNQAGNQNAIFRLPLNPTMNTGTLSPTTGGNIGIFVNGVAMFDFRDGVAWNSNTMSPCGGPGNPPCPGGISYWYRDAVLAERPGFDCAKGHPAGTNYHHHQNPSAFDLDLVVLSTVCNLYDSDGLYTINTAQHSPLIGYAYDGFPIYGAYGYANEDGTGGITRIKSGYQLRNITVRTHHADGTDVPDGPAVSTTYPLGYYREDYEWVAHPGDESYLDVHNGRISVTPEYPNGIYCYYATVDINHNSAYPYLVGPTFYGVKTGAKVTSVPAGTTTYAPLPIELISFDGEYKNDVVQLHWVTASEINNDYFTLERSIDGQNFIKIADIKSSGNTNENTYYQYEDNHFTVGQIYYRLKQTDFDGSYTFSNIIGFNIDKPISEMKVFPSPSADFIAIQASGLVTSDIKIHLFDLQGKLMLESQISAGSTICYLDIQTLYDGHYIIRINDGKQISSHKISVIH
jgi:hypothetical protein